MDLRREKKIRLLVFFLFEWTRGRNLYVNRRRASSKLHVLIEIVVQVLK